MMEKNNTSAWSLPKCPSNAPKNCMRPFSSRKKQQFYLIFNSKLPYWYAHIQLHLIRSLCIMTLSFIHQNVGTKHGFDVQLPKCPSTAPKNCMRPFSSRKKQQFYLILPKSYLTGTTKLNCRQFCPYS